MVTTKNFAIMHFSDLKVKRTDRLYGKGCKRRSNRDGDEE